MTECFLDDDGGPQVDAVEAAPADLHRRALLVRVGPVFHGSEQAAEPGVWVDYQESYQQCLPQPAVLLTPAVWRELAAAVEERLQRWERT